MKNESGPNKTVALRASGLFCAAPTWRLLTPPAQRLKQSRADFRRPDGVALRHELPPSADGPGAPLVTKSLVEVN